MNVVAATGTPQVHTRARGMHIEMRDVTTRFGTLVANDGISLTFEPGAIHVLVGENGAGKSTLMNVLSGSVDPDHGQVLLGGDDITTLGARQRIERGIGMVHQHFKLVNDFTVAENIALGAEPTRRGKILDIATARATARDTSTRFGLPLDPDATVGGLPIGLRQRVEIVKVLARDASVLVFDEPTAVLTDEEAAGLFDVMRSLRDTGRTIVFITHKLRDALALADRVSVLRRGRLVATLDPAATSVDELGTLMVGREIRNVGRQYRRADSRHDGDAPVMSVESIRMSRRDPHGVDLDDVTLHVGRGEIVGLLGVEGNGQHELTAVLTGAARPDEGRVTMSGKEMTGQPPAAFLQAGLGVVPADRQRDGLVTSMSIGRNLVLDRRNERQFTRFFGLLLDDAGIERHATETIQRYDIRAAGSDARVGTLSGGNQQKVVLARELERELVAVVVAHPTRGLDVGSIEYVHTRILDVARSGCGVVLVTSDIDEALALSDRIVVMYRGTIAGEETPPFRRQRIGVLLGGGGQ